MVVGTVVGVLQTNVKRMLAYSSIAHAGYLLLGIVAANDGGQGGGAVLPARLRRRQIGALGIVALLGTAERPHDQLRDFAGLWNTRPGLAGLMTVFLLSLGGFPPTAGFIGKWYIFSRGGAGRALLARDHRRPVQRRVGVLLPAHRGDDVHDGGGRCAGAAGGVRHCRWPALNVAMVATFYLGILPARVIDYALQSIQTIF